MPLLGAVRLKYSWTTWASKVFEHGHIQSFLGAMMLLNPIILEDIYHGRLTMSLDVPWPKRLQINWTFDILCPKLSSFLGVSKQLHSVAAFLSGTGCSLKPNLSFPHSPENEANETNLIKQPIKYFEMSDNNTKNWDVCRVFFPLPM